MGPPRVWLRDQDIPGLAMTRSFGDQVASTVGITALPEITEWQLTPEDKFMILASDGVWEFIESDEVK
jgi:serine/threonine protein phosphatase PrpC